MRIRVLALHTTCNGDYCGVMDSEDGPMIFFIGPSQIRILSDLGDQLYKTVDQSYNTIDSVDQCAKIIWDSIQFAPITQTSDPVAC